MGGNRGAWTFVWTFSAGGTSLVPRSRVSHTRSRQSAHDAPAYLVWASLLYCSCSCLIFLARLLPMPVKLQRLPGTWPLG
jgi:hypothetical protein